MHVPGLGKVPALLLGRGSKETGLSRCARVDSVGLAKRRLAAKAAQEEQSADAAELDTAGAGADCPLAVQEDLEPEAAAESEAILLNLIGRQHRDSLRIHRRRLRERASLELPCPDTKGCPPQNGISWSSDRSPSGVPAGQDGQEDDNDNGPNNEAALHERTSCPSTTSRRVRIRRASDGEYLTTTRAHKAHHHLHQPSRSHSQQHHEGGLPQALRAVQIKAERLFRRLTAHFTESSHPPRPRSATSSRGISPTRAQRSATSRNASASRSSPSWGALRNRSMDAAGAPRGQSGAGDDDDDDDEGATLPRPAATAAAVAAASASVAPPAVDDDDDARAGRSRRAQRQSAPGELFFTSFGAGGVAPEPGSPPLCPASGTHRVNSLSSKGGGGGGSSAGKSRNWLARLSRGLTSSSHTYKATATAPTSPPAWPSLESPAPPAKGTVVPDAEITAAAAAAAPVVLPLVGTVQAGGS